MKVLITGATGLIGTKLVAELLQQNISLNYLSTSKAKIVEKPNYHGFYWNPSKGIIDQNAFQEIDVIVHLAGSPIINRWTEKNKKEIIESRTVSAQLLLDTLKKIPNQIKHYVSASAIGIYPDSFDKLWTENDIVVAPNFPGEVVAKWEASADKFKTLNINVCKLRTGLVLSNKSGFLVEMARPIKLGLGAPLGSGRQMQSWIHIDDLIQIYVSAIKYSWEGAYNAVAPNPVTNKELIKAIAKKMKKPLFMPNVPRWIMKLVLGEMHIMLFLSQYVSAEKVISKGFTFKYEFLEPALDDLLSSEKPNAKILD